MILTLCSIILHFPAANVEQAFENSVGRVQIARIGQSEIFRKYERKTHITYKWGINPFNLKEYKKILTEQRIKHFAPQGLSYPYTFKE